MSTFTEEISQVNPNLSKVKSPILPFLHTTTSYQFLNILEDGGLRPMICPVLKEELVYMFYGKPSYRPKTSRTKNIVIVGFKNRYNFQNIFPFDSGGFWRYPNASNFDLNRFKVQDFDSDTLKFIAHFYSNYPNYLSSTISLKPSPNLPCLKFIFDLVINRGALGDYDSRASTVECSVSHKIPIEDISFLLCERKFAKTISRRFGKLNMEIIPVSFELLNRNEDINFGFMLGKYDSEILKKLL